VRPDVHGLVMDPKNARKTPTIGVSRLSVGILDPLVVLTPMLQLIPSDKSMPAILLVRHRVFSGQRSA
jgi:hypothetical protein